LSLVELVEEAFERAGGELRSGYDLRTARRSLNLLFADWANRGLNLWTIEQTTEALTSGSEIYSLATDTVDVLEAIIRTNAGTASQFDYPVQRISASEYAKLANKEMTGRPYQVWYNRTVDYPVATFWPVPDAAYSFIYWRLRRVADLTGSDAEPEVPFRFLPALTAGLAFYLAQKLPEGQMRLQFLKAEYEQAWQDAAYEDREKSPLRIIPRGYRVR
jgi:hypothetical protein